MARILYAATAALFGSALLAGAEPAPPKPATGIVILGFTTPNPATAAKVSVAPGRFVPITSADGSPSYIEDAPGYRVYRVAKGSAYVGIKYDAAADAEPEENVWDTDVMVLLARQAPGTYKIQLVKNGEGKGPPVRNGAPIDLEVQGAIPPPKVDPKVEPAPEPKPVEPKPAPVTSFRVMLVYDSKKALSIPQHSVIYGKTVSDYLIANCTKDSDGSQGWRRKDSSQSAEAESPGIKAAWEAAKPALTDIPCVVIVVNNKATIEALPATPEATVSLLKKYKEGK